MLVGEDDIAGVAIPLEVRIPSGYPYVPPKVRPVDGSGGAGWHQERDGSLCLWDAERAQPDWWTSRDAVVERVRDWFHQAANGWRDDAPDMDLDRYWPQSLGLVLYDELPTFGWVRLSGGPRPRHVCPVWDVKGNGSSSKRGRAAGYVISIGEPARPPRSLPELLLLVDGDDLGAALDKRQVGWSPFPENLGKTSMRASASREANITSSGMPRSGLSSLPFNVPWGRLSSLPS